MSDIVVTTPNTARERAAREGKEARACVEAGGEAWYVRDLGPDRPRRLGEGDRVYYVEGRFVRGFATVAAVTQDPETTCGATGREFGPSWYAVMDARSWRWVEPVYVGAGFQGWRYADGFLDVAGGVEVVGGWRDPRPDPTPDPTPDDRLRRFGASVRSYRHGLGLSQERLAERAGLDQTYLSGIETGRRNPTVRVILRLADALGRGPDELLAGV